jgi:required for meiotic nuclear division protein 1
VTAASHEHRIHAVAFAENFSPKDLTRAFPEGRLGTQKALLVPMGGGEMSLYPFGGVAFRDVPEEKQREQLGRLRQALPGLSAAILEEDFLVAEGMAGDRPRVESGMLHIDRLDAERGQVVALVVAQSAAMEYFERIVDGMFADTERLVGGLERTGNVSMRVRSLHKFIGGAMVTRSEVLSVLHLLDKPDETWDDPLVDRIYDELRQEFDLLDRYRALEAKLRAVQESLELVLSIASERRVFALEVAVVALIVLEIVLSLVRH